MKVRTHCFKTEKRRMYVVFEGKYDSTVIGVASSLVKAERLAKDYNEIYKEIDSSADLIENKDVWIEEFPLDKLIEL